MRSFKKRKRDSTPRPRSRIAFRCKSSNCTTSRRNGLTLFELLLALAIFLASLAALAHSCWTSGSRAAAQAKLQTEAILRCESKLGELVSGITADQDGLPAKDPLTTIQVGRGD